MARESRKPKMDVIMLIGKYGLGFFVILVAIIFGIIDSAFVKPSNVINILSSMCVTGLAGMGITCIYACGEMDFGAGVEISLGGCSMALLLRSTLHNYYAAFIVTLLILALYGLVNAFIHIKVGIPAFIATLGTSYLCKGYLKYMTEGGGIYALPQWPREFTVLGQGFVFGNIPVPIIVLALVSVSMLVFTEKTRFGKYIFAVGRNPVACRYIGIDANAQKAMSFVICSVFCGISGIVQGSMINGCLATMGDAIFNQALTVLFFGALFLKMGTYNVPGTLLGSLLIAIIYNGLTILQAPVFYREIIQGTLLLAAVILVTTIKYRGISSR